MERRKILLGSGAALATVLAGCSSDETDDDSKSDSDGDEPLDDDDGGDETDGTNDGTDDGTEIPGLDSDKLTIDSTKISIKDVNKDGDEIDIIATTTTTDPETLSAELESLGSTLSAAITDAEKLAAAINSITWVIEKDGAKVMSFYVDVKWALAYLNNEMGEDEFVESVLDTTDETY
ncbi:hypothetical protein [Natrinema pallidum]|uniref:DUF8159 domain-containing protein n=2 Tax=Natrinema pallidum TaxID=69527 RepID=L9YR63_9EURY|nr:hypothetical protein [Natrinema pallidum]ELY76604.1 hypothetical protein C487_10987 [Natrinema pallidum DSM 3751]QCW02969.1 hypothetical protein FGF80_06850 [Natrinema pallidum]